jgi:hypothetical protein
VATGCASRRTARQPPFFGHFGQPVQQHMHFGPQLHALIRLAPQQEAASGEVSCFMQP